MRTFEEALVAVRDVEGWLSQDQADELYQAAVATHAGEQIVEIGSFRGRSTIVLASAAPEGVAIVAIDPHAGNDRGPQEIAGFAAEADDDHVAFTANLVAAGVPHRVRHVRAFSDAAHAEIVGDIAMLYVDGAHRYGPARADIRDWGRRVAPGGAMLIHDAFSSVGVTAAIMRELMFGSRFRYVRRARSLVVYRADLDGSRRSRLGNSLRQAAVLPWFARNVALKLLLTAGLGRLMQRFGAREPEWPY